MKRKTVGLILTVFMAGGMCFLSIQSAKASSNAFSDWSAEDVESDAFLGMIDIYTNISIEPFSPLGLKMGVESVEYAVIHGAIYTAPKHTLTEIFGYDVLQTSTLDIVASSDFITTNHQLDEGMGVKAYGDYTETGYTGFSDRDTDPVSQYTEKELLTYDSNSLVVFNASEYFDDTSLPADNLNEIVDDESEFYGVNYVAQDGKTIQEYAVDIADSYGGTFVDIANASIVFFAFEELYNMMNLQVTFDQEIGGAIPAGMGVNAFMIKRRSFPFFQRERDEVQDTPKIRESLFKKLTGAVSGLVDIPADATHYVKKAVGSAFHGLNLGVRGIVGNFWAFVRGWVGKVFSFFGGLIGIGFLAVAGFITWRIVKKRRG